VCFIVQRDKNSTMITKACYPNPDFSGAQGGVFEKVNSLLGAARQENSRQLLDAAVHAKDWPNALQVLEGSQWQVGAKDQAAHDVTAAIVFTANGLFDKALARGKEVLAQTADPCLLDQMAWALLYSKNRLPSENVLLADAMARTAHVGSLKKECQVRHLRTLARATFLKGDPAKAAEQAKAAFDIIDNFGHNSGYVVPECKVSANVLWEEVESYRQAVLPPL
jgi:hypothetical protein